MSNREITGSDHDGDPFRVVFMERRIVRVEQLNEVIVFELVIASSIAADHSDNRILNLRSLQGSEVEIVMPRLLALKVLEACEDALRGGALC